MPLHHRRILFSYDDDNHGACETRDSCTSPPSPPPYTPPPTLSPSPSPYWSSSIPHPTPDHAPAPSPARHPAAGRRNQGGTTKGYGPPPGAAATDGHHRRFVVTNVLAASATLVFLSLILLGVSVAVRRRNLRRRRRQALLAPAPAATTNDDPEGGGGGVVHHVWYIRTVGLDQAVIDSIAATRYRAGAGLLGAADCSVCLGEFSDGELVRLLPKCGHAFHVPCIDTWLRAHVNCPLCRSDVIDPTAAETGGVDSIPNSNEPADPDANAITAAEQVAVAIDDSSTTEQEDEDNDQEEPQVEEDQHEQQLSSPEPLPQLPCPLPWNVRRAASMDAATVSAAVDVAALDRLPEAAPEGEQSDRVKDRTGIVRLASGGPSRFFFSRHCRARSSVLPV